MTFVFQGVINVGIQILLLIALGWSFARYGLLDQARFMPQVNLLFLQASPFAGRRKAGWVGRGVVPESINQCRRNGPCLAGSSRAWTASFTG